MGVMYLTAVEPRRARIRLLGPFAVETPDGTDVTPKGKRARALLALLALAPNGARSRRWVQDKLWSDRPQEQGSASLRQEISGLRRLFRDAGLDILDSDREVLRLDLAAVARDIDDPAAPTRGLDLLEGLDIRDPEFEEWLRTERMRLDTTLAQPPAASAGAVPRPAARPAGKPYLVVRGFQPIGGSERARIFAEGLTDELLIMLGSLAGVFAVRTNERDRHDAASYELSGHVRDGDRLRVTARLLALDSEDCIWSGRFDYEGDAAFDAQEEISRKVIEAAQIQLSDGEMARIWADATTSIRAWELFQRGHALEALIRRETTRRAIQLYREALAVDPEFTPAMISLGSCLVDQVRLGWAPNTAEVQREVLELCAAIRQRNPANDFGRALAAFVESIRGNPIGARDIMAEIVRDAPESPELQASYGTMLAYCGEVDAAIRYTQLALSLTRHPLNWIRTNLAFTSLQRGNPRGDAEAARYVESALAIDPGSVRGHLCRVVIAVRAGRMPEARDWAARLLALDPEFRAARWSAKECFRDPRFFQRIASELGAAGL